MAPDTASHSYAVPESATCNTRGRVESSGAVTDEMSRIRSGRESEISGAPQNLSINRLASSWCGYLSSTTQPRRLYLQSRANCL